MRTIILKKRKHHIVPRCYLKNFAAGDGNIWTYRLDSPAKPFSTNYKNVGHIRDYYTQPKPGGAIDYNLLENLFDETVEQKWSYLVELIVNKENLSPEQMDDVVTFLMLQRVRVPAARDMIEAILANGVRMTGQMLEAQGELPLAPSPLMTNDGLDWDRIDVAIDPHKSIHAMVNLVQGMGIVLDAMGYVALQNSTDLPFITSDNPICYYIPTKNKDFRPYTLRLPDSPVELIFPITHNIVLIGQNILKGQFDVEGLLYGDIDDVNEVKDINNTIARFAYENVYSSTQDNADIIVQHAEYTPVPKFTSLPGPDGIYQIIETVFGPRSRKPKWKGFKAR